MCKLEGRSRKSAELSAMGLNQFRFKPSLNFRVLPNVKDSALWSFLVKKQKLCLLTNLLNAFPSLHLGVSYRHPLISGIV